MQFFLYCLCGGAGVSTDFAVYYICLTQGVWYQLANILGYVAGTFVSFFLNRIFTFGVKDKVVQRLMTFLLVATLGYLSSAAMLWVLIDIFQMDARLAKILTLPLVVVLQFSLNRRFTFRSKASAQATALNN